MVSERRQKDICPPYKDTILVVENRASNNKMVVGNRE